MATTKAIITTTSTIRDADNRAVTGWIRIRPNKPFEYDSGAGIVAVTDAPVRKQLLAGKLAETLELAVNTGASNSPETHYLVEIDTGRTVLKQYWQIDNADADSLEYANITQLAGPETQSNTLAEHLAAQNPHGQYVRHSDTTDTPVAAESSVGKGLIPLLDPATGLLSMAFLDPQASQVDVADASGYWTAETLEDVLDEIGAALLALAGAFPSGTRMIFQQATAPAGWTKETGAAYNDAMAVVSTGAFTVGASDTGGSSDAKSHSHTVNSHTHTGPSHTHSFSDTGAVSTVIEVNPVGILTGGAGSDNVVSYAGTGWQDASNVRLKNGSVSISGTTGSGGTGNTGAASPGTTTFSPKYFLQIIASKD